MSTVRDVAKKAGVSVGTVSNVCNGQQGVSAETADKVLRAVKTLGYEPRRGRRRGDQEGIRTGLLGLLYVGLPQELLQLPFYARFVSCLEPELARRDLHMILAHMPDRHALPPHLPIRNMDGAFLVGNPGHNIRRTFQRLHVIRVLGQPRDWSDWVGTDARKHGKMAAEYLLERGHRRLAFLNPDRAHTVSAELGRSFQETVGLHGMEASMLVAQRKYDQPYFWTTQRYRQMVEELLPAYFALPAEERPTGMYVANDQTTMVTYQVLQEHGVKAGVDIEIISNDNDEPFLAGLTPRPATIEPDFAEIARRAVEKVLYRIKYPDAPVGAHTYICPHLVRP